MTDHRSLDQSGAVMKALVYHGAGNKAWEETPDPVIIDDTDAIVRVEATTICGTDLHILKGDVPAVTDGRVLGHEAIGTVTARRRARPAVSLSATVCSCRASRHVAPAVTAVMATPGNASAVAVGFSATRSTARRPNSSASRSPISRPIRFPTAWPTRPF